MVLSLMILPLGERPFSQLLPMGAATFYMCLTTYFLKGAFERESRGASGWLFLAGIAALLAYAAKLTMIFFGLPLSITLLVVLLRDRQIFRAVAFFSPLIVGFIIEVWMVHQGTGSLLGRALYVISELNSHGRGLNYLGTLDAAADLGGWGFGGFWEYFLLSPAKYFEALGLYSLVIYASVLLALYELVYRRRNQQDRKLDFCLAGTIVGFFLLQSYVVVSFEPYIFPEKYIHERYQYALFILCGIFLIRRVCENKWLRESGKGLGGSNRLFVIAVLVLVFSSLFLSNNIFSRHNNFGFVVTIVHERFLSKWEDDGGALGYLANAPGDGSLSGARSALLNTAHAAVIPRYVKAIYLFDYCELEDSYVYVDSDRVYGLCSPWKMNETVLIYQIYNVSLIRPNNLRFLGKFSGDNGS